MKTPIPLLIIYISVICILLTNAIFAQDSNNTSKNITIAIPEIAILDLEIKNFVDDSQDSYEIRSKIDTVEAGNANGQGNLINKPMWLNYSSIVSQSKPERSIQVSIVQGNIPEEIELYLETISFNGDQGAGKQGQSTTKVHLNNIGQNLITDIGSAYTGDGIENGYELQYSLKLNEERYKDMEVSELLNNITVSYTFTDS